MEMLNIFKVTSAYAACLGMMCIILALNVVRMRWKYRVGIGGGHKALDRSIRVHGNFSEYAPLALVLIAFCEVNGASNSSLHIMGACLILGRIMHAIGLGTNAGTSFLRFTGMVLTFISVGYASILLFAHAM